MTVAMRIRIEDDPLLIDQEAVAMWFLEFTAGEVMPVQAYLVKKSLGNLPDPDIATATITWDLWGDVDGVETHIQDGVSCTLEDEETGLVSFSLPVGGLVDEGDNFRGRFTMTHVDGRVECYPHGRQHVNVLVRRA